MSVRNALLGLLAQRPRHGYELHAAFEATVGGEQNWDVKPAQIYITLARLKQSGLVAEEASEQDGGPEKRIYAITSAGRDELSAWLSAPVKTEHQRADLYREQHALTARRGNTDPERGLAHILLLDQATMHLEADLRWLDMIETRLDEVRRQPPPEPEPRPRGRPPKGR